jgi:hypothetical protein
MPTKIRSPPPRDVFGVVFVYAEKMTFLEIPDIFFFFLDVGQYMIKFCQMLTARNLRNNCSNSELNGRCLVQTSCPWLRVGPGSQARDLGPTQEDRRDLELASKKTLHFDREVLQNNVSGARLKSD